MEKEGQDKIIVFDELNIFSLVRLLSLRRNAKVYYFDGTESFISVFNKMKAAGIIKTDIVKMKFNFSELREDNGESSNSRIVNKELPNLLSRATEEVLRNNRAIRNVTAAVGKQDKGLFYFLTAASSDIGKKLIRMNAIDWYARTGKIQTGSEIEYVVANNPFIGVFKRYAAEKRIKITGRFPGFGKVLEGWAAIFLFIFVLPPKDIFVSLLKAREINKLTKRERDVKVSVFYGGRGMTFDLKKKCDFFWLLKFESLWPRVLIYSIYNRDFPVSEKTIKEIKDHGLSFFPVVKGITTADDVPIWISTALYFKRLFKLNLLACAAIFRDLLRGKTDFLYFANKIFSFNRIYAFWFDFFRTLDLRMNFSPPDYDPRTILINLAMENSGGISLSYQISDFEAPDLVFSSSANVFFSFGPYYTDKIKGSGPNIIDSLVFCGYLTDYAFNEVKANSSRLRRSLLEKGVDFIVSYFDENSSDNSLAFIKSSVAALIYNKLFEQVIKDERFGLICKPKKPRTLRKRIPAVVDLMDKAIETGRCVFLDEGDYISNTYPSEAAQASDMAVGLFASGTTVLESFLSGVPTVYLDLEKRYSRTGCSSSKDGLVFDSLDGLFNKIDEFRKDVKVGNHIKRILEEIVKGKDPFRDGMASERMATYTHWLLESLDKGKKREEAMEYANKLYKERWGSDKVVNMRIKNGQT